MYKLDEIINTVVNDDCLNVLKDLPDNSVDSVVTDPPYELGFMGKSWDNTGIANNKEMWAECLRVLKHGGHLLAFSGTRTYHRMACAIEDAGFEVRDMIEWVYGSGFPKSLNIGKAVDKLLGNEREVVGYAKSNPDLRDVGRISKETTGIDKLSFGQAQGAKRQQTPIDKGTSEWEGWGTALKPAHEPICMARKPLAEKTVAENCLKWGTGGINIEQSRVEFGEETDSRVGTIDKQTGAMGKGAFGEKSGKDISISTYKEGGRFPANLIHDNSEEVRECFPETKSGNLLPGHKRGDGTGNSLMGGGGIVEGTYGGDSGNASRFFKSIIYQAKASKSERNKGCEELEMKRMATDEVMKERLGNNWENIDRPHIRPSLRQNNHPTVKPIALMEYLIKMVTPKGGIVIDPFAGSGSTLVACKQNGFGYIGIEKELDYIKIAEARINNLAQGVLNF